MHLKEQTKACFLIFYVTASATWCDYDAADDDDNDDDDDDACTLVGLANICAIKTRAPSDLNLFKGFEVMQN